MLCGSHHVTYVSFSQIPLNVSARILLLNCEQFIVAR